jgi:hypothetical protein
LAHYEFGDQTIECLAAARTWLSQRGHWSGAATIADDRKGWLFRTSPRHNATVLTERPVT